jgi:N6-adenosine-specific RNA methylase IME4
MTELAQLEQAERLLAQVASVQDAVDLVNWAEQARVFAKQAKLGTGAINHATVIKLRAERMVAEHVDAGQAAGQIAEHGTNQHRGGPDSGPPPTLSELGLSKQRVAEARIIRNAYSDAELAELARDATDSDRLLSRDKIVRSAGWAQREHQQGRYADTSNLGHADVIYLDPPWRYDVQISDARAIENQYPTMTFDELATLRIPAGDNAVMFCWVTAPQTDVAVDLIRAWGFTYRTQLVWVKDKIGMGYYARGQHELLFVATKGTPTIPAPADRPSSVITAPRREHSRKPDAVYDLIDRMYPNASKRELFARTRHDGWLEPWGLDVPK